MLERLIHRPVAVTMILLTGIVIGCVCMRQLPVSLIPDMDVPSITVHVDEPLLSAREMDERVLFPLRLRLQQVDGLDDIVTEARDGSGRVRMKFRQGADMDFVFIEVNEKIDRTLPELSGISRPKVLRTGAADIPAFYIDITSRDDTGAADKDDDLFPVSRRFSQLSDFAVTVIAKRIEQLDEVAMVDVSGVVSEEILLLPDREALHRLNIPLSRFESLVRSANVTLGSLTIRDGQYRYPVKFLSYAKSEEDLANLWFKVDDRLLQLRDIAHVVRHPSPRTGLVRSGGKDAVTVAVIKQGDARMADLRRGMDHLLSQFTEDYPDVMFTLTRDQTSLLRFSIDSLLRNILYGILLSILVIFLFMRDFKSPALVALTIPSALILSMPVFLLAGISINIISLSGLILGVGMMVDNSIILVDNITAHWQGGKPLERAVVDGTREVAAPMLSSLLTTCAVFVPLVFVSGTAGAMFHDQAISIATVLGMAYLVTLLVIPVYYCRLYSSQPQFRPARLLRRVLADKIVERRDRAVIAWFLDHRTVSWALLAGCICGAVLLFPVMRKEKLPPMTYTETLLSIDWNEPLSVRENDQRVRELEAVCIQPRHITSLVGAQQFLLAHDGEQGVSEATLYLAFGSETEMEREKQRLAEHLRKRYPLATFGFRVSGNVFDLVFSDQDASLILQLRPVGDDLLAPGTVSGLLQNLSLALPGVEIPQMGVKEEAVWVADPEKMALYGVSFSDLATTLKNALNQNKLFEMVQGDKSVPVVVGTGEQDLDCLLTRAVVRGEGGADIPVSRLMRYVRQENFKTLVAGMEGRYCPVPLDVSWSDAPAVMAAAGEVVRGSGRFEAGFSGTWFSNRKMLIQMLWVMLISVLLLYLILAAQFESLLQPIIILSEIVIDIFFCLVFLWATGMSVNLITMIGLVVICGIVINDSILKIDTINRLRKAGMPLREAVLEGSRRRVKAILMTSLTTILSVLPFLVRGNMGADLQFPMSVIIVVGMVTGTAVSLFVIPTLYESIYRRRG